MTEMPTEQLVVATGKPKIGSRPAPAAPPEPEKAAGGKKSKKKLIMIVLILAVVGGAAYFFLLKPAPAADGAEAVEPPPEPGIVVVIEPISLNLAEGRYLRIGIGLQMTADVAEEPDTARALDQVVTLFSGRTVDEVASTEGREALRVQLIELLDEAYEGEVMDVYFTDYVTQ
jgi:flagellar FliL protein